MGDLLIGVQTRDLPTIGSAGVSPSAINTGGMLVYADRGPESVQELYKFDQVFDIYGRYRQNYNGHYVMKGFFENLQGESASLFVKRMVPSDAVAATEDFPNLFGTPQDTWQITAGRRGELDKGIWGNQILVNIIESSRGGSDVSVAGTASDNFITVTSTAPFEIHDWIQIEGDVAACIDRIDESDNRLYFKTGVVLGGAVTTTKTVTIIDRTIKVYMKDSDNGNIEEVEVIPNLTMDPQSPFYWVDVVNDQFIGSKFIHAKQLVTGQAGTADDFPAVALDDPANATKLSGGANGTTPNDTAMAAMLEAFNDFPVRWITNTESFTETIWADGEQYCRVRGDRVWVGTPPINSTYQASLVWANKKRKSRKIYAWNNREWLIVSDPVGIGPNPVRELPNVGHYMGYAIWINTVRGIHKVPASRIQTPVGIRGLVGELVSRREITDLADAGLNCTTNIGGDFAIRSGRSPSKAKEWKFINAVVMSIYFKQSFEEAARDLENEPNKDILLRSIAGMMSNFAYNFYLGSSNGGSEGGFADGSFSDVTKIVADETINPIAKRNNGELYANFYFAAPSPAERILIGVGLLFNG